MAPSCAPLAQCREYIGERPPFSWFQANEVFQILMVGPEGAGKTTLLYRLKIPGWKKGDITRDMALMKRDCPGPGGDAGPLGSRDPGYHYEELRGANLRSYGIWDVPGNDTFLRLWPMFYRYVRIGAVFFVVDNFSPLRDNVERLNQAREMIRFLLNEDELRGCCFWLILNVSWPEAVEPTESEQEREEAIYEMLGVPEIKAEAPNAGRFFEATLNCAEIARESARWEEILKEIRRAHLHLGPHGSR